MAEVETGDQPESLTDSTVAEEEGCNDSLSYLSHGILLHRSKGMLVSQAATVKIIE